ncbi:MAG: SDR family NAD(P)-dependent oxidoreductase, partial [Acidobacteriota bacterium]|nr:SDR family NAD(P)-dependent oxidoreductase [Acidobacteriota bacterium]
MSDRASASDVAIIGMACRVPGATTLDAFWDNLRNGVESISFFSDEELIAAGVDAAQLRDARYVRARAVLRDVESFDPAFFGLSPREAEIMDPQHRLFLEGAWEALEHAGYDPERYRGSIGVFAGVGMNGYLLHNIYPNRDRLAAVSGFQVMLGNDRDFVATRVSYKLNLRGPSINVQAACSTSLVAVHLACQSLLNGECDIALAGGVSIHVPQTEGYLYQDGMIFSPDGHCRAFDARAEGTVGGSGMGVVILKPLDDAIADRDCIHAIIKGSAINNDGTAKIGYTAPSIDGQASVIAEAQAVAGVDPESVTYVETHGTGTTLGDPIEIAALTLAFRSSRTGFCAIGSVKTNLGHLDAAAGVVSLIKTTLALEHGTIPPSLHFERPNPQIDFSKTPFYVNTSLTPWRADGTPRRAGVSSFGIGGTNAHVVLEEAPPVTAAIDATPEWKVLVLSAKSPTALDQMTRNLRAHLEAHPELDLTDVAYTLAQGRRAFPHRTAIVCRDRAEAISCSAGVPPAFEHAQSWVAGEDVDLYANESRRRVPLPTYSFERQRCWIDAPRAQEKASVAELSALRVADPAEWFYVPSWKRTTPVNQQTESSERWLIFADDCGIGERLAARVSAAGGHVTVVRGDEAYDLTTPPQNIVHLSTVHPSSNVAHALDHGFNSLMRLAKRLGDDVLLPARSKVRMAVVTNNAHDVIGDDLLSPEQAVAFGPAQVIPLEYPNIECRSIDVALPRSIEERERVVDMLFAELSAPSPDRVIAYRGGHRWVRDFERVRLEARPALRQNGVYLITGGGGVGLALARDLVENFGARVALVARSPVESVDDRITVFQADVTDTARMTMVVAEIRSRIGEINGVIHTAGVPPGGLIHHGTRDTAAAVLAPKVAGTLVLQELFKDTTLDFLLLCSSLRSVVPARGMADYIAANAFLDAFAQQQHERLGAISVNWAGWREVGMGVRTGVLAALDERELAEATMSTAEGVTAFRRIISNPRAQVAVSMHDLPTVARLQPELPFAARHARPELEVPYTAPRDPRERTLAAIWQELLGLDRVGIHDNFLELGGDSVLSLQLIARAGQEGLNLTPRQIFEKPTIAELAAVTSSGETARAEQGPVSGDVQLTPVQRWFFEQDPPDPHHFNQTVMLEGPSDLSPDVVRKAVAAIVLHHDALRLRFRRDNDGWHAEHAAVEQAQVFESVNLSHLDGTQQPAALESRAAALQSSLSLSAGPLVRVALFNLGAGKRTRLLIVAHHLCIDAVSWRFLLQDLFAFETLPPKTSSFKQWAEALQTWAESGALQEEIRFWDRMLPTRSPSLPIDFRDGSNAVGQSKSVDIRLTREETEALEGVSRIASARVDEILLAALAITMQRWTQHPSLLVDVEGLGRQAPITNVDVSRTVGWFTSIHPVLLTVRPEATPYDAVEAVKNQLRSVPNSGIGYGVLRY